jgi:hypothetical protein
VIRLALADATAGALAAGNPTLAAQTPAPPGRSARLDAVDGFWSTKYYRLELSQGVAFAFNCTYTGPCEHVAVTSDDPAIAEPRAASLGKLEPNAGIQNQAGSAATVVIARAVGTTRLHLHSSAGDRLIVVTVIAPPAPRG